MSDTDRARINRENDTAHRNHIFHEIADALRAMDGKAAPELIADALMEGQIPHCRVML